MQEFEALRSQLSALGVKVRSVTAQHGDIPAMLSRRGCELDFVEVISDPSFSICKDYQAKGQKLILTTEARPQLLQGLVERDGFKSADHAKHNMVQPGLCVEDAAGNLVYAWSWHDEAEFWTSDGKLINSARKDGTPRVHPADCRVNPCGGEVGRLRRDCDRCVPTGLATQSIPVRAERKLG